MDGLVVARAAPVALTRSVERIVDGISQGEGENESFFPLNSFFFGHTQPEDVGKNTEVQIFHSIRPSDKVLEIESGSIHESPLPLRRISCYQLH